MTIIVRAGKLLASGRAGEAVHLLSAGMERVPPSCMWHGTIPFASGEHLAAAPFHVVSV
jgi:hypothetical protein